MTRQLLILLCVLILSAGVASASPSEVRILMPTHTPAAAQEEPAVTPPPAEEIPAPAEVPALPAEEVSTPTDLAGVPTADEHTILLSMVGDCTIGEAYKKRGYGSSFTSVVTKLGGYAWPFSNFAELFAADDLTLANCEGCFTMKKPVKQNMALTAPAEWAQVFVEGNVDAVNVYNNHQLDFGQAGAENTRDALDAVGVGWFDRSTPWVTEIKGVKTGVIALKSPIRKDQINELPELINQLRNEQGCTFVIISVHWGREDNYAISGDQKKAEQFLDLGADMIYGHGSHTLQPIRYYKGKLIFYSTCNFTFGANGSPHDKDTGVFQVSFRINEDKSVTATHLKVIPCKQNESRDFRPVEYTEEVDRLRCFKKLYGDAKKNKVTSNLPESFLTTGEVDLIAWSEQLAASGQGE